MAILGVVLCTVPLFDLLGYESSASVGLALALLAPAIWLQSPVGRWGSGEDRSDLPGPTRVWSRMVVVGLWLAAIPLVLLLLNALRVPNCAIRDGLAFYGLIVGGSVAMSALWAVLACAVASPGWRRAGVYAIFVLVSVASILGYLALEPPVRAHHPLIGFFAGSIYDEALTVPLGLLIYRLWHAVIIAAALVGLEVAAARSRGESVWRLVVVGIGLLAIAGGMYEQKSALGMEHRRADVEAALGGVHQTEHFTIHYPAHTWHRRQLDAIGADHEYRYRQLTALFGKAPLAEGQRFKSYIYADQRQKGRLLGIRRTLIARLWLGEMHITWSGAGQAVLMHEMAHLFSERHGSGPLSLSSGPGYLPNMGLIEGLAEAVTWQSGELSPHRWSAAMRRLGIAPDVRRLVDAVGFYTASGARSYTVMGSFCRFLIDKHGMDAFLKAYAHGDLEGVYGEPVETLVVQWETFVDGLELTDEEVSLAEFYMDRRSIFQKRCARSIAALRVEGSDKRAAGRIEAALSCFEQVVAFAPGSPYYRLEYASALMALQRDKDAEAQVDAVLAIETLSRPMRAAAWERRGDLAARRGDIEDANEAYAQSLSQRPRWSQRRSAQAKKAALGSKQGRAFFFGGLDRVGMLTAAFRWVESAPDAPLAHYLLGRQLWGARHCGEALRHLRKAEAGRDALPGVAIRAESRRLLGVCQFTVGEYAAAVQTFESLSRDAIPSGMKAEATDWRSRAEEARDSLSNPH